MSESVNNGKETDARNDKGQFKRGNPGRPIGSKNKLTTNIKDMIFEALNNEEVGGTEGFIEWILASKRNKELFYGWLMRMLPTSVVGGQDDKGDFTPLTVIIGDNGDNPDKTP